MKKHITRILKIVIILPSIMFLAIINIPIPISIDIHALEVIVGDPSHVIERTVRIQGWYRINFFVDYHEFRGEIVISGEYITNKELGRLRLQPLAGVGGYRGSLLSYGNIRQVAHASDRDLIDVENFGMIFVRGVFGDAMILPWRDDGNIRSLIGGPVIVLGAASRDEAVERILDAHPASFHPLYD